MTRPGDGPPRLEARGVAKHFGGVKALDGVDLEVRAGEVHAEPLEQVVRLAHQSQPVDERPSQR